MRIEKLGQKRYFQTSHDNKRPDRKALDLLSLQAHELGFFFCDELTRFKVGIAEFATFDLKAPEGAKAVSPFLP